MEPKRMHSYLVNLFAFIFAILLITSVGGPEMGYLTIAVISFTIVLVGYTFSATSKARERDRMEFEYTQKRKGRNYYGR